MGKVIRTLGILLMLVVFPALSWYYLDKGADYRRESISRVEPKEQWNQDQFNELASLAELKGKTTVLLTGDISSKYKTQFYDQFKDAYTFQLVTPNSEMIGENLIISNTNFQGFPSAILIDTSATVRNIYENNPESMKMLIEDTAIVIPKRPAIDITLK